METGEISRVAYPNNSVQQYRKAAVNSASPLQLVIMLYDGAIRFMNQAKDAMEKRELERQNEACKRAQDIISELMSCLDLKQGGEIAQNLFALYTFTFDRIVQANIEDNPLLLDQSIQVLSELRESWATLEQQSQTNHSYANAS
ncbi:flagellar export chaperone FliS [Armatimonadetes bacterium Uphvl-Ar1]|nr:flagellar export chaperone FliS [Armatimonadetes bacterium Uphvl-Ar1]